MRLQTTKHTRRPFNVEAVKVTAENMEQVAKWCRGQVRSSAGPGGRNPQRYIKVPVKIPLTTRQTQAYAGDWVVIALDKPKGFKVYTPKAFASTFDDLVEHMAQTLERMEDRAEEESRLEDEGVFPEELREGYRSVAQ